MAVLNIYTDGGARGNPGLGGIGIVVKTDQGKIIYQVGKGIGHATNNQAEYQAIIHALLWLVKNKPAVDQVNFFLDSNLVVSQMTGKFKVKSNSIRAFWLRAKDLASTVKTKIEYQLIPREANSEADYLLNQALDLSAKSSLPKQVVPGGRQAGLLKSF